MAKLGCRPKAPSEGVSDRLRDESTIAAAQLELQARLGRQLQVFLASRGDCGARGAADRGADGRSLPPPAMPPTIAPRPAPPPTLRAVFLPSPLPLVSTYVGRNLVDHPAEADGVQLQRDLVAALHLPGLLDLDGLQRRRRAARNHDRPADHDRIVDHRLEGLPACEASTSIACVSRRSASCPPGP